MTRDAQSDIWEGGAFLVIAFSFIPPQENIFFCDELQTNFFCFVQKTEISDFVVCLPYHVRYHLLVYSGQHIFHQY